MGFEILPVLCRKCGTVNYFDAPPGRDATCVTCGAALPR